MSRKAGNTIALTTTTNASDIKERHGDVREVFKLFDKDNDGKITRDEVKSLLRALGRSTTPDEIQALINTVDKDNSGTIELQEFTNYLDTAFAVPRSRVEEVVDAFRIFDLDNNGYISAEEFKNILMNYGGNFTAEEVDEIFKEIDVDKDGKLTYAEFVDIWKYQ